MRTFFNRYQHVFYLVLMLILLIINAYALIIPMPLALVVSFMLIILLVLDVKSSAKKALDQEIFTFEANTLKANREINLRSKQLETIIQAITFPLILLDHHKNITKVNQSFINLAKIDKIEDLSIIHIDILRFIDQAFLKETERSVQMLIDDQDYRVFSIPIYEAQRFSGMLFIFQNITEVLERERMQKRFIADASHELKTPIAAIKGMIEILNRPNFKDQVTQQEFQEQIEYETRRMETIVNDMLHLSRLSSKHQLIDYSSFNLNELVHEMIQSYKSEFIKKDIELRVVINESVIVHSDREKLHQILSNLLSNALKYTQQGYISITHSQDDQTWTLYIEDSGQGIKEELQSLIFDRFYRVDESRSRHTGGSGLGLAIVKTYVERLNGSIRVESTIGIGSRFILTFPKL
jgi:two-component system, OmpR family, phosphate regulon sensor histidine kinase PhoR